MSELTELKRMFYRPRNEVRILFVCLH